MKPACVKCQRFFRMKRSGLAFIEGMPTENGALPGTQQPDKWKPYKIWMGDVWACEGCGAEILSGYGQRPFAEHYQPDFADVMRDSEAELQINDC